MKHFTNSHHQQSSYCRHMNMIFNWNLRSVCFEFLQMKFLKNIYAFFHSHQLIANYFLMVIRFEKKKMSFWVWVRDIVLGGMDWLSVKQEIHTKIDSHWKNFYVRMRNERKKSASRRASCVCLSSIKKKMWDM